MTIPGVLARNLARVLEKHQGLLQIKLILGIGQRKRRYGHQMTPEGSYLVIAICIPLADLVTTIRPKLHRLFFV